jgi:Restriction endonuclease
VPRRTNAFQQLIHLIEHQLALSDAVVTESKEYIDQVTGKKREVDIVIERKSGIHSFVIGIECRDWAAPQSATWIEEMHSKHQDIGIDKTILVSKSGFYKPALAKAKQRKIDTLNLSEAEESDWVTYTNRLSTLTELTVQSPKVKLTGFEVHANFSSSPPESGVETMIYDAKGNQLMTIGQLIDRVVNTDVNFRAHVDEIAVPTTEEPFAFRILAHEDDVYIEDSSETKCQLGLIVLKGKCWLETSTLSLNRANYGSASVLHGAGQHMNHNVQVAWTEEADGRMFFGASISEPEPPED